MENYNKELYHYGVKGMKWGVRRASRKLAKATTRAEYDKYAAKLKKHQAKGSAEVTKLKAKNPKLQDKLAVSEQRDRTKAVKYARKARRYDVKANSAGRAARNILLPKSIREYAKGKRDKNQLKAERLHAKADRYRNNYERNKAKVENNKAMQEAFQRQLDSIDKALVDNGKRYLQLAV